MPRPKKTHLYYSKSKGLWLIIDGKRQSSTGCALDQQGEAERVLAQYIVGRHKPGFTSTDPAGVRVLDVLLYYRDEHMGSVKRPDAIQSACANLGKFWAGHAVKDVTKVTCRKYVSWRTNQVSARHKKVEGRVVPRISVETARKELELFRAAIRFAVDNNNLDYAVPVELPQKSAPRERYLTRTEAARLIWKAWRGEKSKHIARFILVALYTGTRHSAICKLGWKPTREGGWVDIERGLMFRKGIGEGETKKRRPPVAISGRLAAHLKRWRRHSLQYVIEYDQRPVAKIERFETSVRNAGLDGNVTPHVLRHTFASWALMGGRTLDEVAEALGTTRAMVERTYGHLESSYTKQTVETVARRAK